MLPMSSDLRVEANYIKGVSSIGPLACQSMCGVASVKLANSFSSNQQVLRTNRGPDLWDFYYEAHGWCQSCTSCGRQL